MLKQQIEEKGWAIVKNVLTKGEASFAHDMYLDWIESVPQLAALPRMHGIFNMVKHRINSLHGGYVHIQM